MSKYVIGDPDSKLGMSRISGIRPDVSIFVVLPDIQFNLQLSQIFSVSDQAPRPGYPVNLTSG